MNIDNNFPDLVLLDEVRLRQILLNIIGNALKFTEKGKIDVNLSYNSNNSLIFEIEDTDIGIKESSINTIFDEFKQQDEQLTRKYGGTGLGLSISKKLAEMMNGTISVKSKFGEGSTFKVEFKDVEILIKAQKEEKLSEINVEFQKSKILIVDDNDLNLFLIETILKQLGDFKIIKATNGQQAVERIKDNNINLVFMDIHMPVMDGKTASIKIKENINSKIPVVALTALAMSHDVEEYSKYFDGYIVKPVEINKVREVLQKYIINNVTETTISQEKNSEKFQLGQNDIFSINKIINTEIDILINSLEIDRISEIANKILEVGKNKENKKIHEFGQELMDLCDSFDIENIIKKLKILK
jgi:CheY-like chemotaxis protein